MKNNKLMWIVSIIPLIISAVAIPFLPDEIPMHYDMAGNIDRWGSKYETFIFPILIIGFTIMWQCMIYYYDKKSTKAKVEKERVEAASNVKVLRLVAISMAIAFGIMHIAITYSSYKESISNATASAVDINVVANVTWGIALVIIGGYLPKAKRNGIVGFRTNKTLSDDTIWQKANRFSGITLMIAGVLCVIETLIFGGLLSTGIMVGILILCTVVDVVYVAKL